MLEDSLTVDEKNEIEKDLAKAMYRVKVYKENKAEIEQLQKE